RRDRSLSRGRPAGCHSPMRASASSPSALLREPAAPEFRSSLRSPLGLSFEVQIRLDRMDAPNSVDDVRSREDWVIVRHNEPGVCPTFLLSESEALSELVVRFLRQEKGYQSEASELRY